VEAVAEEVVDRGEEVGSTVAEGPLATKIASEGPPPGAPVTLQGVETFELISQA
jgi:hypothetical protein